MSESRFMLALSRPVLVTGLAVLGSGIPAEAQQNPWGPEQTTVPVAVDVVPMAEIQFPDGTAGLHLTVPPATSTIPDQGLRFLVRGNALAWVTAQPAQFLLVQHYFIGTTDFGPRYLGKAVLPGGQEIGYNLQVEFPIGNYAALPGTDGGSTPANPINMTLVGGETTGFLHLVASHRWTPMGWMPSVGDYNGNVVVTVGADPL